MDNTAPQTLDSRFIAHLRHVKESLLRLEDFDSPLSDVQDFTGFQDEDFRTLASLLRTHGDSVLAAFHETLMKFKKDWVKAADEYTAVASAQNPNYPKIEAARIVRDDAHALFKSAFADFMRAKGIEEYCRVLPLMQASVEWAHKESFDAYLRWAGGVERWVWAVTGK